MFSVGVSAPHPSTAILPSSLAVSGWSASLSLSSLPAFQQSLVVGPGLLPIPAKLVTQILSRKCVFEPPCNIERSPAGPDPQLKRCTE